MSQNFRKGNFQQNVPSLTPPPPPLDSCILVLKKNVSKNWKYTFEWPLGWWIKNVYQVFALKKLCKLLQETFCSFFVIVGCISRENRNIFFSSWKSSLKWPVTAAAQDSEHFIAKKKFQNISYYQKLCKNQSVPSVTLLPVHFSQNWKKKTGSQQKNISILCFPITLDTWST